MRVCLLNQYVKSRSWKTSAARFTEGTMKKKNRTAGKKLRCERHLCANWLSCFTEFFAFSSCRRSSSCTSRATWAPLLLWWLLTSPGWTGKCGLLPWGLIRKLHGSAASYTDCCRVKETVRKLLCHVPSLHPLTSHLAYFYIWRCLFFFLNLTQIFTLWWSELTVVGIFSQNW